MPVDYVLKVDFLREIQEMHDNFQIKSIINLISLWKRCLKVQMSYILEVQEDENGDQYIVFP